MEIADRLPNLHEIHIFLFNLNPSNEEVEKYLSAVKEWNDCHPNVQHPMKGCLLALIFRDSNGKEQEITVMQSARYFRSDIYSIVEHECHLDAEWFKQHGFAIAREKIEATVFGNTNIPQTPEECEKYFEFHVKVQKKKDSTPIISLEELSELKAISERFSKKFKVPVPLSYNKLKDKTGSDGEGGQRFLNMRFRKTGRDACWKVIMDLKDAIEKETSFTFSKSISEYVWFDTYPEMDQGW
jgi:hypothetical protein